MNTIVIKLKLSLLFDSSMTATFHVLLYIGTSIMLFVLPIVNLKLVDVRTVNHSVYESRQHATQ